MNSHGFSVCVRLSRGMWVLSVVPLRFRYAFKHLPSCMVMRPFSCCCSFCFVLQMDEDSSTSIDDNKVGASVEGVPIVVDETIVSEVAVVEAVSLKVLIPINWLINPRIFM